MADTTHKTNDNETVSYFILYLITSNEFHPFKFLVRMRETAGSCSG